MRRTAVIAAACIASFASPAAGKGGAALCGQKTHEKFDETRIYSRDFIASCRPGGECRVVTYRLDSAAPLGFSHHLAFSRNSTDMPWQVETVSVMELANTGEGFRLIVDRKNVIDISEGQISTPVSVNEYVIEPTLSEAILRSAKPGNVIRWEYISQSGELREAGFSLIGLTNALEWVQCAQAKLASGKSDPADGSDEQVEYSPPEPDVPVSPDDSKD